MRFALFQHIRKIFTRPSPARNHNCVDNDVSGTWGSKRFAKSMRGCPDVDAILVLLECWWWWKQPLIGCWWPRYPLQVHYPTALDYFVFISFTYIFSTVVQVGWLWNLHLHFLTFSMTIVRSCPLLHKSWKWRVLPGGAGGWALSYGRLILILLEPCPVVCWGLCCYFFMFIRLVP